VVIQVYLNGFHGDCSAMFLIGDVDKDGQALVKATELSLERAISICRPGEFFCNIGNFFILLVFYICTQTFFLGRWGEGSMNYY
jgi:methionine aminopeptidase